MFVTELRALSLGNLLNTVKPVLSGHSKIDEMKVLKTGGSLMQVWSTKILLTCIKW